LFCRSPLARKGRKEEAILDPLVAWFFLLWRVNPLAAVEVTGGANASPLFLRPIKFQHGSRVQAIDILIMFFYLWKVFL
jgi:hypothetical protein